MRKHKIGIALLAIAALAYATTSRARTNQKKEQQEVAPSQKPFVALLAENKLIAKKSVEEPQRTNNWRRWVSDLIGGR